MKVLLVRHGTDDFDAPESTGRRQAEEIARRIGAFSLNPARTHLFSSDVSRALETARVIQERLALSTIVIYEWLGFSDDEQSALFQHITAVVEEFEDQDEWLIVVTHEPHIKTLLEQFAQLYGVTLLSTLKVEQGSVFLVDTDALYIGKLFVPKMH